MKQLVKVILLQVGSLGNKQYLFTKGVELTLENKASGRDTREGCLCLLLPLL